MDNRITFDELQLAFPKLDELTRAKISIAVLEQRLEEAREEISRLLHANQVMEQAVQKQPQLRTPTEPVVEPIVPAIDYV